MSLRQWFVSKFPLNKQKKQGLIAEKATGISEFGADAVEKTFFQKNFWFVTFIFSIALIAIPASLFFSELRQWVRATAWQTRQVFDSSGDVGLYGSTAQNSSGLPATVYYDKTNNKVKFAQRSSGGVWTIEDVETLGADYSTGINSDKNTKFGIALDPSDNKMSVAYCDYAAGGTANQSALHFAHRVASGNGNCGTGNNWQCDTTYGFYNTACAMRMISLAYATTSSQPSLAYIEDDTLNFNEYLPGQGWNRTTVVNHNSGLKFDENQTALSYLSNGAPIIFFIQNDGAANNILKYTYRSTVDWTWSAPATIRSESWDNTSVQPYALSVIKDPNVTDLFHIVTGMNGDLHYITLNSSFVVGTDTAVDTGSFTWNSIMIQANGYPAISYYDRAGDQLKYASYNGSSWTTETVDTGSGQYVGLIPGSGDSNPNMCYYDTSGGNNVFITQDNAPSAPTVLYVSTSTTQFGFANPTQITTTTPVFSAKFQDPDSGDTSAKAQIQVTTATDGFATVNKWDSGATTFASPISVNARSVDFKYGEFGNAPSASLQIGDNGWVTSGTDTPYYWRIRFWDQNDVAGAWSATGTFTIVDAPAAPTNLVLNIPYPYTTADNAIVFTKDPAWPDVAQTAEVVHVIDGMMLSYEHIASTTINHSFTTDTIALPTDFFNIDNHYMLAVRNYNAAGYSNYSSIKNFDAFRRPTITVQSATCTSLNFDWVDPHFSGSSSFYFQLEDNLAPYGLQYSDVGPSSSKSVSNLVGGALYEYTVHVVSDDLRFGGTDYISASTTGRLLACDPVVSVQQIGSNEAKVIWNSSGNAGGHYVVRNETTDEEQVVSGTDPQNWTFSGLVTNQTYTFTVKSYNADNVTSGNVGTASITMAGSSFGQQAVNNYPASGSFKVYQEGVPEGYALSEDVLLDITAASAGWMKISNTPDFADSRWLTVPENIIRKFPWKLSGVTRGAPPEHTVYLKFLNMSGQLESSTYAQTITIDQSGLQPPTILFPADGAQSSDGKFLYSGTAASGAHIRLSTKDDAGAMLVIGETDASTQSPGTWSIVGTQALSEGPHDIYAVTLGDDGKRSAPATIRIFVNSNMPSLPQTPIIQNPKQGSTITSRMVTTSGLSDPLAHIIIKNYVGNSDDIDTVTTDADATGHWSVTLPIPIGLGSHTYSYFAKNDAGVMSYPTVLGFTVSLEPVIPIPPPLPEVVKEPIPVVPLPKERTPLPAIKEPPAPPPALTSFKKEVVPPPTTDTSAPSDTTKTSTPGSGTSNSGGTGVAANNSAGPTAPTQVATNNTSFEIKTQAVEIINKIANINSDNFGKTTTEVAVQTVEQTKKVAIRTTQTVKKAAEVARVVADTPQVQTANTVVVVPAAATVAAASVGTAVNVPQAVLYLRFLFTQPLSLINRRRRKKWGMVYNAITKMPLDLVVVRLVEVESNRLVQSRVTDRAGRYQFFAQPGSYKIEASKADFNFPPTYLQGKKEDGSITDLYLGDVIKIDKAGPISYNIPLDPIGAQKSIAQILKESTKKRAAEIISFSGVMVTAISFIITPTPLVAAFLAAHVGSFFLFRRLAIGKRPKGWGIVSDVATREPVERAVVRIFDTQYSKLLETQVTDSNGHYAFLVGKNQYYVMAEHVGHKKYVSNPVAINNEAEGGVVGFDIPLVQEAQKFDITSVPAVHTEQDTKTATEPTRYLPKIQMAHEEKPVGVAGALLRNVNETHESAVDVASISQFAQKNPAQDTAVFTKVENIASAQTLTAPNKLNTPALRGASTTGLAKLLQPVTSGSRDLVIIGLPKEIKIENDLFSGGNFLKK